MSDHPDRPTAHHAPDSAWDLPPEPTNLVVPWPGDAPPACDDLVAALGGRAIDAAPTDDPRVLWSRAVEIDGAGIAVLWAESARAVGNDLDDDARACAWVLGVETVLDTADPLSSLVTWLAAVVRGAPQAPGVIDVNTATWHPRAELLAQLGGDAPEAPADLLWITHVVRAAGLGAWLHTHGLWRCGRPELEMLDVPDDALAVAAELMGHVAHLLLEHDETPPADRLAIGHGLELRLRPWNEVAEAIGAGAPGGPDDRNDPAHVGPRVVLCEASGPAGSLHPWPRDAVARLERGDAPLFMTTRATRRQAEAARSTWDAFIAALDENDADSELLVKVALAGSGDELREHVWCRALRREGEAVDAELVNRPVAVVSERVAPDGRLRVGRDDVTDWRVVAGGRAFTPDSAAALARASEDRA